MTRDCTVYAISVLGLIVCLADELVFWYEAATFVGLYILYIIRKLIINFMSSYSGAVAFTLVFLSQNYLVGKSAS
jgi:hypothetical protein